MKAYLFAILLSFFSLGSFAIKITISLKQAPDKPLKINFLSYKLTSKADTLYTLSLTETEPATVTLLLSTPQFIDIRSPRQYGHGMFYIDPSQEYEFVYDQRQDKWEVIAGNIGLNERFEPDFKAITSGIRLYQPDSATFVNQFLRLADSLKLYNNDIPNITEKIRQDFSRRIAFYSFVNTAKGRNLFQFNAAAQDSITRKVVSLIDLNEIDLSIHSTADFNALHYYHLVHIYAIFPKEDWSGSKINQAKVYQRINKWTSGLSASDEVKAFLIGDFIKYHSMIGQYEFTEEALVYLEEYLKNYPDSPYSEWIEKEYKKRYNQLSNSSVLLIDCSDLEGKKFRASAYDEPFLFIDFWATWCGPCIAENPYIEQLKKEYAGKVRFIKISVDQYESGWRSFLGKDPKNTKDSYLLSKKNRIETMDYYDLNAIPKFMIIDRNGQVIDFTPPRPSDPKVREVLDKMLE